VAHDSEPWSVIDKLVPVKKNQAHMSLK